jgi:hypothetical protein
VRRLAAASLLLLAACAACAGDPSHSLDAGPAPDAGAAPAPDAAGPDAPLPDPCADVVAACPTDEALAAVVEGAGLVAIERCAFPLVDRDEWAARAAALDALDADLDSTDVAGVLADLNRSAPRLPAVDVPGDPPGVTRAFGWQAGDQDVAYWIPQGITGSGDAGDGAGVSAGRVAGRDVVIVSWYYDRAEDAGSTAEKGVRLAIADVTDPDDVRYRLVLLVDPELVDGQPTFTSVPIHAGGIAWVGRYLYVADTFTGLRVFDLGRILRVATGVDAIGYDAATGAYHAHNYAYAVPQVDTLADDGACAPRFSFVALDRATSPPSLVSGEYSATTVTGRLFRWPLDGATGRPRLVAGGRLVPGGAWLSGHSHVQGALALGDTFWLSSSKPAAGAGDLYRARAGAASATLPWIDAPEDLYHDPVDDVVWSLSEGQGARYVFAAARAALQ